VKRAFRAHAATRPGSGALSFPPPSGDTGAYRRRPRSSGHQRFGGPWGGYIGCRVSFRWPLVALLVSLAGWLTPLIVGQGGGRGGGTGAGFPAWAVVSFVIGALALLAFIALLVAALSLRNRD
jgi:hypothetical protein